MAILSLVVWLPFACLLVYQGFSRFHAEKARAEASVRATAEFAAFDVARFVERIRTLLETLTDSPLVAALDPERCDPRLGEFRGVVTQATNIFTLAADGRIVCSVVAMPPGVVRAPDPSLYLDELRKTRAFTVGRPAIGVMSRRWVVTFAQPIVDSRGELRGAVAMSIDLLKLAQSRGTLGAQYDASTGAVLPDGTVLWRNPDPEQWLGRKPAAIERLVREFAGGKSTAVTTSLVGDEKVYAVARVPGTDWRVFTGVPTANVYSAARIDAIAQATASLIALLAAVALSVVMARRISSPIRALAEGTKRIASGDLDARMPVEGPEEIASIAREVNDVVAARAVAEGALKTSEESYRRIFDGAGEGIIVFQSERVMLSNAAAVRMSGWRADQLAGVDPIELMHPDDRPALRDWRARAARGEAVSMHLEFRLLRADGSTLWVETTATTIEWRGQPAYLVTLTDVSERRRAQARLRESEERYRVAFMTSPDAVTITDVGEGRYLDVNEGFTRTFGWTREEALGRASRELDVWLRGEDRSRFMDAFNATGRIDDFETGFRTKDGRVIVARVTARAVTLSGRACILAMTHDVTHRKRIEDQLRKLSLAVEQSPESVVITNLDAQIEYVNEAFLGATGYARDEVIGRNPRVLQSGRTPQSTYDDMWRALAQGLPWKGEFVNRRKDGSEYVEQAIVAPIRQPDGTVSHYLAVKEDITEKKLLADQLAAHRDHLEAIVTGRTAELAEARRRADDANLAKSAFLANMSHEIRTPMNAILGFAHLLRRSPLSGEQRERLDKLSDAGEHLLAVINDILDFSKIEAGKLVLERIDFTLHSILEGVGALVGEQAREKGLRVVLQFDSVPESLRGDPTRLRQALLNFASNAVKFTDRGTITIAARLESEEAHRVRVRFEVRDTGAGIPADKLAGLFQMFQQVDASTTRKHGGTGLGLAITRRLAQQMGGDAGAESEVGAGSRFWFTAWLERGAALEPASAAVAGNPEDELRRAHRGARVLLAEDDAINQMVALALLSDVGLAVDVANDGREAVSMAAAGYDLILMDMQMPVMDGLEATRAIRALPDRGRTPIVAMTANAFDEDRRRCVDAGMDDFVAKPVDPEVLFATVLRWLSARGDARD